MSAQPERIKLAEKLDLMAANELYKVLSSIEGKPVQLDASEVSHIDLPCLQILISAKQFWQRHSIAFSIENLSEKFIDNLTTLGLTSSIFETLEHQNVA